MAHALPAQTVIAGVLIRRDQLDRVRNRFAHKALQRLRVGILNHLADDVTLARDRADDRDLTSRTARATARSAAADSAAVAILRLAADVGFVDLDNARQLDEFLIASRRGCDGTYTTRSGRSRCRSCR